MRSYERGVGSILKHKAPYLLAYLIIVVGMIWLFTRIPTAFLPEEDQGVLFAQVQMDAAWVTTPTRPAAVAAAVPQQDALAQLDTGDARWRAAADKARRASKALRAISSAL